MIYVMIMHERRIKSVYAVLCFMKISFIWFICISHMKWLTEFAVYALAYLYELFAMSRSNELKCNVQACSDVGILHRRALDPNAPLQYNESRETSSQLTNAQVSDYSHLRLQLIRTWWGTECGRVFVEINSRRFITF